MRVVLLRDIPKIGRKYEVKEVNDGYARNFLIARGMAKIAAEGSFYSKTNPAVQETLLEKGLARIADAVITFKKETNKEGHLFAAIHEKDIVQKINEEHNFQLNPEDIIIDSLIKRVGEHEIKIKKGNKSISLKVAVQSLLKNARHFD